jgi:CrcB protein
VTSPPGDPQRDPVDPDLAPEGETAGIAARPAQLAIVAAVAVGGVFGAVSRYAISLAIPETASGFPWATFLVNITGSAVLGFLVTLLAGQFPRARLARPLLGTGFVGAYTTFSTFTVEAVLLVRAHHPVVAAAYLLSSVVAGLGAAWAGIVAARQAAAVAGPRQREPG